jgi:hypothetical protein
LHLQLAEGIEGDQPVEKFAPAAITVDCIILYPLIGGIGNPPGLGDVELDQADLSEVRQGVDEVLDAYAVSVGVHLNRTQGNDSDHFSFTMR